MNLKKVTCYTAFAMSIASVLQILLSFVTITVNNATLVTPISNIVINTMFFGSALIIYAVLKEKDNYGMSFIAFLLFMLTVVVYNPLRVGVGSDLTAIIFGILFAVLYFFVSWKLTSHKLPSKVEEYITAGKFKTKAEKQAEKASKTEVVETVKETKEDTKKVEEKTPDSVE